VCLKFKGVNLYVYVLGQ